MSKRTERVADLIRRTLAEMLLHKLRDPRLGFVSVTAVEVAPDLSNARIFVSSLDGEAKSATLLSVLRRAAPFLRHELAPVLQLREVPTLSFAYDDSIERGARVEELLRKLHDGEAIASGDDDDATGPDATGPDAEPADGAEEDA